MPYRYRDEDDSGSTILVATIGAIAGFAAGVLVAQRYGGLDGLTARLREQFGKGLDTGRRMAAEAVDGFETFDEDEIEDDDEYGDGYDAAAAELEERVLEAFTNDPIMSERAVDIGALGEGIIELSGWVYTEEESDHAVVLTRGVPGVETVVNRLSVREEEEILEDNIRRVEEGDPALTESHSEGQQVGIGKRRQGNSSELDRHADPKVTLEDRWLDTDKALEAAAEDTVGIAERRGRKAAARRTTSD